MVRINAIRTALRSLRSSILGSFRGSRKTDFSGSLSIFTLPLLFAASAFANPWEAKSDEEALFLRRIADFWQEGEYKIVKGQIEEFLKDYPDSSFAESLSTTLGDLFIREKDYKSALTQYTRIKDPALVQQVFLNRMQCLLELQWHATLADECEAYLAKETIDPQEKLRVTYLLALALYQQCTNSNDPDVVQRLALRAQPHFQFLLKSELSGDVAQAFAHLCCILKDYPAASKIYLDLAGENNEEMLFQAALLQAEFDKQAAIQTFDKIALLGKSKSQDAIYNRLVLIYDTGRYEEILEKKDELLAQIPEERRDVAHLFFGRSYLQLKKHPEALQELLLYADKATPSDALRTALVDILETSYQLGDEANLKKSLSRMAELFPDDNQLPKGLLAHALLLKKNERWNEAKEELEAIRTRYNAAQEGDRALFEELHMEFQQNRWTDCLSHCREYLQRFPKNDLNTYVQRFLICASAHLAAENPASELKETLVADLQALLSQKEALPLSEANDWRFLLAKTHYELHHFTNAIQLLEPLSREMGFHDRPNALLLLALSYRDGAGTRRAFVKMENWLSIYTPICSMSAPFISPFLTAISRIMKSSAPRTTFSSPLKSFSSTRIICFGSPIIIMRKKQILPARFVSSSNF